MPNGGEAGWQGKKEDDSAGEGANKRGGKSEAYCENGRGERQKRELRCR